MFHGVSSDVTGYDSSLNIMSAHICTGHRCLPVRHWVYVAFFTPFLYVLKFGETLYARWIRPMLCVSLRRFLYNMMSPIQRMRVCFASPLGFVEYSHDRMPKKKSTAIS